MSKNLRRWEHKRYWRGCGRTVGVIILQPHERQTGNERLDLGGHFQFEDIDRQNVLTFFEKSIIYISSKSQIAGEPQQVVQHLLGMGMFPIETLSCV